MVEGNEIVDGLLQKWVAFLRKYKVVGDPNWNSLGEDHRIDEERIHGAYAADIEVQVNATVIVKNKIPNCISTLDGVGIVVESFEEPRIFLSNELAGARICP